MLSLKPMHLYRPCELSDEELFSLTGALIYIVANQTYMSELPIKDRAGVEYEFMFEVEGFDDQERAIVGGVAPKEPGDEMRGVYLTEIIEFSIMQLPKKKRE